MKTIIIKTICFLLIVSGAFAANSEFAYWDKAYEESLLEKVGAKLPKLVTLQIFFAQRSHKPAYRFIN